MNSLIEWLEKAGNWKQILRSACKKNHFCTSLAGELTPSKLNLLKERFKKAYETNPNSLSQSWIEHEMRAFNWILIAVSAEKNVNIEDFGAQEWKLLAQIFDQKTMAFLRYETRRFLLQKKAKNKNWSPEQNQIIDELIKNYESDKIAWNQVARALFQESQQKYFRTAKHCRQHWYNYLDPSKDRGQWTKAKDIELLEKVEKEGKKWAKLGAQFNRTEHSVKNRFNSIISKQKKASPNLKKEEKIIDAAKQYLNNMIENQAEEEKQQNKSGHPIKINLKMSSQSMYNENRSQPYITFHEIEPIQRNPIDLTRNITLQGGQYVQHLLKEEQDPNIKNEPTHFSSFWNPSPKNLTPLGFSPSPFSLSMSCNYYIHNFNMEMQRQNENQQRGQRK